MKRIYSVLIGIAVLVIAFLLFRVLGEQGTKEAIAETTNTKAPLVEVIEVNPSSRSFLISATGTLRAKEKIEIFSEVQGLLLPNNPAFKEGNIFQKGRPVIKINDAEYLAQLKSSKSNFMSQIAAILPDMEIEFPKAAQKWEKYLREFDVDQPLRPLPKVESDEVKFFITGRNIIQSYYNVKNQEERLGKYTIYAPFSGVLTEANVNPGALVRNGQKLGELIDPSVFELKIMVPASQNEYLKMGSSATLKTVEGRSEYSGKISRINPKINQQTQTIEVYVEVSHPDLKEGQYLNAKIRGEKIFDVVPITSNLLTANESVYVVRNEQLELQKVEPINYVEDSLVVRGLKPGTWLVKQAIASAYPGMKVEVKKSTAGL
ncbi:efflux RND transporter periplasmic adaptor subunit [Ekhidna sp.]